MDYIPGASRLALDELVKRTRRQRTYFGGRTAMQERLDVILPEARIVNASLGIEPVSFTDEEREVLSWVYWNSIRSYGGAERRKLGGDYFNHPDDVFRVALGSGNTDLVSLACALDHDVVEEQIAAVWMDRFRMQVERDADLKRIRVSGGHIDEEERKDALERRMNAIRATNDRYFTEKKKKRQGKVGPRGHPGRLRGASSREQRMIIEYLGRHEQRIEQGLRKLKAHYSVTCVDPAQFAAEQKEVLCLLTRKRRDNYYLAMKHVFKPRWQVSPLALERAIMVKFYDRRGNMGDMDLPWADLVRNESIPYNSIISLWDQNIPVEGRNRESRKEALRSRAASFAELAREPHPKAYTMEARLYQCYKSLMLINCYRERKNAGGIIDAVTNVHLAAETARQAEMVLDHLCASSLDGTHMTPDKVWEIHQSHLDYAQRGGYDKVTRAGDHVFDGVIARFFDTRVHGDKAPLRQLSNDPFRLVVAAVAFKHVAERYVNEPDYFMKGLSTSGIKPRAPIRRKSS